MKSTAKKQSVYYHVTRFGDAAQILKTRKMIGSPLNENEEDSHVNAGYRTRGYFISLSRSMRHCHLLCACRITLRGVFGRVVATTLPLLRRGQL